jgi:hypothetical protein
LDNSGNGKETALSAALSKHEDELLAKGLAPNDAYEKYAIAVLTEEFRKTGRRAPPLYKIEPTIKALCLKDPKLSWGLNCLNGGYFLPRILNAAATKINAAFEAEEREEEKRRAAEAAREAERAKKDAGIRPGQTAGGAQTIEARPDAQKMDLDGQDDEDVQLKLAVQVQPGMGRKDQFRADTHPAIVPSPQPSATGGAQTQRLGPGAVDTQRAKARPLPPVQARPPSRQILITQPSPVQNPETMKRLLSVTRVTIFDTFAVEGKALGDWLPSEMHRYMARTSKARGLFAKLVDGIPYVQDKHEKRIRHYYEDNEPLVRSWIREFYGEKAA